jgi:hypothetical protein
MNPKVCQNVRAGPPNVDGTNMFHNHITGNANKKISSAAIATAPRATPMIVASCFILFAFYIL